MLLLLIFWICFEFLPVSLDMGSRYYIAGDIRISNFLLMLLKQISLQNFRSYPQATFAFDPAITIIIGPNTAGKTNLMEAIWLLSTGKSFRVEKDVQMIMFDKDIARLKGKIGEGTEKEIAEVMLAQGTTTGGRFIKRYSINDIPKRRADFAGRLPAVLFSPEELDIVSAGPSLRRRFLNDILDQVDIEYRRASILYEKALRQRNALLDLAKEIGKRNEEQFTYWDTLLIANGQYLTKKRGEFIEFINKAQKDIFDFSITYDASIISEDRLFQYREAEVGSGVTLVGPHRDDFFIYHNQQEVKYFGSRGQQRLAVLQLKLFQLQFIKQTIQKNPLLMLDDIFSELDSRHMDLVLSMIGQQQTIMTTTHKEFIDEKHLQQAKIITLEKD